MSGFGGRAEVARKRCHLRVWHETDMPKYLGDVRCWVNSGKHVLALSFSGFDPNATSTRRGPSHPAYDGHFDLAPPPIPAGSGCVISSRIGMGISVAGLRRGER